jgi:hypothetical protein
MPNSLSRNRPNLQLTRCLWWFGIFPPANGGLVEKISLNSPNLTHALSYVQLQI